jgi:hypothetical protein
MSQDQNAGQNDNIKTGNKSFEIPFMKKLRAD